MRVRFFVIILFAFLLNTVVLIAQDVPATAPAEADTAAFLAKHFGGDLAVLPKSPVLAGDMDGDGSEDVVFVVTGKNPLANEAGHNYKVLDPYNAYFGWGDPKMSMGFVSMDPGPAKYLAVIHGWKLPTPKSKFILVNIPFQSLSMGSFRVKKKTVSAIIAEEAGGVNAAVFFDGKKYKWEAFGAN